MKKLKLSTNAFNKGEVLSRAQLKKVMGGLGSNQCVTKSYDSSGNLRETNTYTYQGWGCGSMSSDAQAKASGTQTSGGYGGTTTYDCGCDGVGV